MMRSSVSASWTYRPGTANFGARAQVRRALVETFAAHISRSVQHTLYAMGEAALAACVDVADITLRLPNRHHLLVDLSPFGLDNPNEIFVATDQPFGLIEATIRRTPR
jgi:urate oxidase